MSSLSNRTAAALLARSSIVALTLVCAVPALAGHREEDDAAKTKAIDTPKPEEDGDRAGNTDIVVTAQRREQRLQEVPTAVTALSSELFSEGGIGRSANEVLNLVPNASAGTQQHGRPRWWIRGVGAGQQQLDLANPVGFYLDDVYISNASATGLPLFDIERVEVLRGPQGTLWGKNTTGGAINVISKRPSLTGGADQNYVKLEYGSFDNKIAEAGVGVAVVPDALAVRVSARIDDREGRFTNLFTGEKSNAVRDNVVRGQLLLAPAPGFEALLSLHYRDYQTDGTYWTTASYLSSGVFRNGYIPSTDKDEISTNAGEFSRTKQFGGSLHLDWDVGTLSLTAITGYESFKTRSAGDGDYTPLEISRSYTRARSQQWTQELRLASPQADRLNWILGLYYFNEKILSNAWSATLPAGSVQAQPGSTAPAAYSLTRYDHRAESGAAFGSATFDFSDAAKITLGARWTRETKTLDFDRSASPNAAATSWSNYIHWWDSYTGSFGGPGTFSNDLKRTWDAFTYDVTPSWTIAPDNLLYFKYSHGVKSGGFNTAATLPVALVAVEPEKLDAFELGYKSQWFDRRLTFNATLFHYDYRDVQINVVGPNPGAVGGATVSYLQNAAKARTNGAEIELEARPVEGLSLTGAVGILDTKYDELQVVNGGADLSGARFVRAPKLTLNGSATYTIPLGASGSVDLAADARYTSRQFYYITPQDTVNRYLLTQKGYTIANARISYTDASDRYTVSAFVNNLFDTDYLNHALPSANPGQGITGDTVAWGDPRTYGVSLIARF
ncbi:TonB-dependent receptor [Sphingomonas psychrotolerans]|uniref:TonB-dependent receptor n=1 Tax=Sphingomonas psychrotolerans TaxID=1327635 RepID=A0ABU3MYB8_9SPHN|nr:TonB-dependent receptor [Sphingomonas psychrotolerans]MDT8757222.1 TonB-dependent receptor [Sphingomonas psychrotolerans]